MEDRKYPLGQDTGYYARIHTLIRGPRESPRENLKLPSGVSNELECAGEEGEKLSTESGLIL